MRDKAANSAEASCYRSQDGFQRSWAQILTGRVSGLVHDQAVVAALDFDRHAGIHLSTGTDGFHGHALSSFADSNNDAANGIDLTGY